MNKHEEKENQLRARRKRVILRKKLSLAFGWFGVMTPAIVGIGLLVFWIKGGVFTSAIIVPVSVGCAINVIIGLLFLKSWKRSQSQKGVRSHGY